MKEVLLKSAKLLGEWSNMKWTGLYSSCCKSHLLKLIIHTSIVFVLRLAHRYRIIPSNATDDQTPHRIITQTLPPPASPSTSSPSPLPAHSLPSDTTSSAAHYYSQSSSSSTPLRTSQPEPNPTPSQP